MTSLRTLSFSSAPRHRQQGAVLAVSMILLLIMTMLAISGGQAVRMQERMASNLRDVDLALQGAEAGLRDAENAINGLTAWPTMCTSATATGCAMFDIGVLRTTAAFDLRTQNQAWWNNSAQDYRGATSLSGLSRDPQFVTERAAQLCDTAEAPCPEADMLYYFRNTARAPGAAGILGEGGADVRIESTYVRRAP
jgi:type IV pilus assembly protein PilX